MTLRFYEVPLSARSQRTSITLLNTTYQLAITWRDAISHWVLDMSDGQGSPVLQGIPLIAGTNLLGQFKHLGIGAGLLVMLDNGTDETVTYPGLGSSAHVRFVVSA